MTVPDSSTAWRGTAEQAIAASGPKRFTLPQFGIFAQGTHAHRFLEFDLNEGATAGQAVASFRELRTPDVSAGGVNIVLAFGPELWRGVAAAAAPADLAPFSEIRGRNGKHAPAAQHDAWLWVSGAEPDVTWQSTRAGYKRSPRSPPLPWSRSASPTVVAAMSPASSTAPRTRSRDGRLTLR